ncbi:MAG TPA: glutathione peroxidase, partial [Giesbergeria sp.]|nr:glutathione peroxidase [Giesbergeria sp.]
MSARALALLLALVPPMVLAASPSPAPAQVAAAAREPAASACPALLNYTIPKLQDESPQSL